MSINSYQSSDVSIIIKDKKISSKKLENVCLFMLLLDHLFIESCRSIQDWYITSTGLGTAKMGWDVRLKAALVQVGCLFGPSKSFTGLGIPSCSWNGKMHCSKITDPKIKNELKSRTVFRYPSDLKKDKWTKQLLKIWQI